MSRRLWVAGLAVVFLAAVAAWNLYLFAVRPRGHVNPERFARIEEGMTLAEVEAVIGLRPGDYTVTRHPSWFELYRYEKALVIHLWPPRSTKHWVSDAGGIEVVFESGRVVQKRYHDPAGWGERGWVDTLRCLAPRPD